MDYTLYARTDLACERKTNSVCEKIHGVTVTETTEDGRYVTLDVGKLWLSDDDNTERAVLAVSDVLSSFLCKLTSKKNQDLRILVAGLGNRFITADAIGPMTVDKLTVTGRDTAENNKRHAEICAILPGVLGQTGIEAASIIRGAVRETCPDVVIAVDALAARSSKRLGVTVQLSDGGIRPGSGIGMRRAAINRESIGLPVVSVGVPTVTDSSTLVSDALREAGIDSFSPPLIEVLENGKSFFVSPKECDVITDTLSSVIASAIEMTAGIY